MNIKKIRINNFKSIYNEIELNFEDIKGFWKISGSVGAGKTTIGEAIIYGLFGCVNGKNNTDLISWGEKCGHIEIWCESKGKDIYIKRELKLHGQSPVYVEINNEELIFTNKRDAQLQLETEYYDTSKMVLELLCIISFNNFKSLASLNTTDTKKFLDQVLGFYILTEYTDICKTLKKNNLDNIDKTNNDINTRRYQVNKLNELSNQTLIEGNIEDVKKDINKLNEDIKIDKEFYNPKLMDFKDRKRQLENELISITTLGKNKANEINFIKKGICPTCGASIDQSKLDIKLKEKEVLGKQYSDIKEKINEIDKNYNDIFIEAYNTINKKKEILEDKNRLLIQLEEQSKRTNINIQEVNSIEKEISDLIAKLSSYNAEDSQWAELYNILSNVVRSKILESFIPTLNDNIQKYVNLLQLPYIIKFDNLFKCNIELYGLNNKIPISSLSTGQLKIVDMVIILGILGTILGNSGINIIFLDELFSNLDSELREDMCKVLKQTMPKDKTIFIISHQDISSNIFNGIINLKLENRNTFERQTKMIINKN